MRREKGKGGGSCGSFEATITWEWSPDMDRQKDRRSRMSVLE